MPDRATTTERYGARAVASLTDYLEDNLATFLTATETDLSLAAGALTPPVAYAETVILNDPRSPVVMVDCGNGTITDWGAGLSEYDCVVLLAFSGDADVKAGSIKARRYATAVIDAIRGSATLGNLVDYAEVTRVEFDAETDGEKYTRHAIGVHVMIRIHELEQT